MKFRYILSCFLLIAPVLLHAQQPIDFIENRGQWDGTFKYKATTDRGEVFLDKGGFMYLLGDPTNRPNMDAVHHGQMKSTQLKFHAYEVTFEGSSTESITGSKQQTTYYNYFLGNKSDRWKSNIHPFHDLEYNKLYNGIDMHVTSEGAHIEYSFIVHAQADPSLIKVKFNGPDKLKIKEGNLEISTSVGAVLEMKPYAYQYINDAKVEVPCSYKLKNNTVTYSFPSDYDHSQLLVIDPTIVFCTFTGSTADNWGFTATYDAAGNFYAGGLVNALPGYNPNITNPHYPVSPGAFQLTFGGGSATNGSDYPCDIAIMKFDPTGVNRIYATYIGGSDNEQPHSLIVDPATNNLILAGRTYSHDYPVTANAYDTSQNGGADIVVTVLNPNATALIGSTYVGGSGDDVVNYNPLEGTFGNLKHNYGDDARSEVQIDNSGNIYVAACTKSTNFPTTANAYQTSLSGTQDGVVLKLNSNVTSLIWSTYIGGSSDDAAYVLAFNSTQSSFYVGGGTMSSNFPTVGSGYHSAYQGGASDGFILKFQNGGTYSLQNSTFIGTSNEDQVYGLQVDKADNVWAMGQSLGGTFPVSAGVYSNANSSQFVIKLDNALSSNIYSTVYGSGDPNHTNISPVAFLVDTCGNVYISGWGGNLAFSTAPASVGNTNNLPVTTNPPAAQSTTDGNDFYFIVFGKNLNSLLYATYFGRYSSDAGKGEHVDGGTSRFDKNGIIYEAICGNCAGYPGYTVTHFPTQPSGVWSTEDSNGNCNEVALKIAFQFGPVQAHASASPTTHGCAPFTVQFTNTSTNGASYWWDFADGSATSTTFSPSHTFTAPGVYNVKMAVYNVNACSKLSDTMVLTITVDTVSVHPAFTYIILDSCSPYTASFTNTSVFSSTPGSQSFTTFTWNFGDGTVYTGDNPPSHVFPAADSYTVVLIMTDTSACNSPDSTKQKLKFSDLRTTAAFSSPDTVCKGVTFNITDNSINATTSYWNYGNGQTSGQSLNTFRYDSSGTYTITLIANNPGACKGTDTFRKVVTVLSPPKADFDFSPSPPETNTPETFTNKSQLADHYLWDFGDGVTTTVFSPVHLFEVTGNFNVCLTAYNKNNCPDKICKSVASDVQALADLPKAFSPNGDGKNDILYVRGASIKTMDLKIYDRWGTMVFHSTSQDVGWDGTFNGKPQEMDAYAFVLNIVFYDESKFQKKGNITLLR